MSTHAVATGDAAVDVPRGGVLGAAQSALTMVNNLMAVLSALAIGAAGVVLTWEVDRALFPQHPKRLAG